MGSSRNQAESRQRLPTMSKPALRPRATPVCLTEVERDAGHMSICQTRDKTTKGRLFIFKFLWRYYKHVDLKEHFKFLVTI